MCSIWRVISRRYSTRSWCASNRLSGDAEGSQTLQSLIYRHLELTDSARAREILGDWPRFAAKFWQISSAPAGGGEAGRQRHARPGRRDSEPRAGNRGQAVSLAVPSGGRGDRHPVAGRDTTPRPPGWLPSWPEPASATSVLRNDVCRFLAVAIGGCKLTALCCRVCRECAERRGTRQRSCRALSAVDRLHLYLPAVRLIIRIVTRLS